MWLPNAVAIGLFSLLLDACAAKPAMLTPIKRYNGYPLAPQRNSIYNSFTYPHGVTSTATVTGTARTVTTTVLALPCTNTIPKSTTTVTTTNTIPPCSNAAVPLSQTTTVTVTITGQPCTSTAPAVTSTVTSSMTTSGATVTTSTTLAPVTTIITITVPGMIETITDDEPGTTYTSSTTLDASTTTITITLPADTTMVTTTATESSYTVTTEFDTETVYTTITSTCEITYTDTSTLDGYGVYYSTRIDGSASTAADCCQQCYMLSGCQEYVFDTYNGECFLYYNGRNADGSHPDRSTTCPAGIFHDTSGITDSPTVAYIVKGVDQCGTFS